MPNDPKNSDALLIAACRETTEAGEAFDAAVEVSDKGAFDAREWKAFDVVIATAATTAAGLAAKAALLVRWQEYTECPQLALSIAKDAVTLAERLAYHR